MEQGNSGAYLGHDSLVRSKMRLAALAAEDSVLVQVDVINETHFKVFPLNGYCRLCIVKVKTRLRVLLKV